MLFLEFSEFENRFWTSIACFMSIVCFRVSDSPLYIPHELTVVRWNLVVLITFLAHNCDRHYLRQQLKRDLRIAPNIPMDNNMRDLLKQVEEHLKWIDNPWISSAIMNCVMILKVLDTEKKLIRMYSDCTQQELNFLVTHSLALIMYKIKDHKWWNRKYRTQFIETLTERRISELTVHSRCILVDALQIMKLSAHPKAEIYVKNIFLKTVGDNLSELKCLSDSKGDFQSMHKLIYFDIKSDDIRQAILDHIKNQARVQKAHMRLRTTQSRRRGIYAWRKVLSDVDDTLLCSGGAYPAGVDQSIPRKILYPGVLGFYRELDLGDTGPDEWDSQRTGNLVFLSARPHVYSDISERNMYDMLNNLQLTRGLYTSPSLLCGSIRTGAQYMLNNSMEPLALKKVESFKQYADLYAEFEFILIGDNGQGDVRAAELIHEDSLYRGNFKRAYMHKVKPLSETHCLKESTKTMDCPFICYFTTYVEAAIDAYEHDLIRIGGLRQIAVESVKDFENINWGLFGNKRTDANIVQSPRMSASNQNLSGSSGVKNVRATSKSSQRVSLKESFRKRYMRLLELNASLAKANTLLVRNGLQPVALLKFECLYERGTQVITPFGPGVVVWFRPHDGTYEVLLQLGLGDSEDNLLRTKSFQSNMAYLRSDSLLPFRTPSNSWMPKFRTSSQLSFAASSSANKDLRQNLKTYKKSGTTAEMIKDAKLAVLKDPDGESVVEQTVIIHKWIVWTPYGLGILLSDPVDPPPPPLSTNTPPKSVKGVAVPLDKRMVKVKLSWNAVITILRSEIVKMKIIPVKVTPPVASSTGKNSNHMDMAMLRPSQSLSETNPNPTSAKDGDALNLDMRAILSPTRRKRGASVDGCEDRHGGDTLRAASTESRLGRLSFVPLYNRFFGSSDSQSEARGEIKQSESQEKDAATEEHEVLSDALKSCGGPSTNSSADSFCGDSINDSSDLLKQCNRFDSEHLETEEVDNEVGLNIDDVNDQNDIHLQLPSLSRTRSNTFT